jgi:hypothetical protein
MEDSRDSVHCATDAICDGLRRLGDISYAILPADIAHSLGDFKKAVLSHIRSCIDKDIEWIDERVAGGDRLRQEWREKCRRDETGETPPEPVI